MKKLLFIFICLINLCFANEAVPHLYILHINGVNTEDKDAETNAKKLAATTSIKSNMITFNYVYNPTSGGDKNPGLWTNLMDVAKQKMFEGKDSMTLDDFTRAWLLNEGKDPDRMTPQEYAEAKAGIEDDYKKALNGEFGDNIDAIIDNFHGNVPVEFKSVVDLLNTPYVPHPLAATYQIVDHKQISSESTENKLNLFSVLSEYNKTHALTSHSVLDYSKTKNLVLLVPHSQGNLYANDLYTYLTKQEHFPKYQLAVYGIASPADHINGDWIAKLFQNIAKQDVSFAAKFLPLDSYITSTHDFVINSARTVFYSNPAMPGNVNTPIGHNLVDVYLSDPTARAQISKMITLEAYYLTGSMSLDKETINHFNLAIASPMYSQHNDMLITSNNQAICNIDNCINDVMYFFTDVAGYNQNYLFFPKSKFGNSSFKITMSNFSNPVFIFLAQPVNFKNNNVSCYHSLEDDKIYCKGSSSIYTSDSIVSQIYNDAKLYWLYVITGFPQYFENGMFITNEFTVN